MTTAQPSKAEGFESFVLVLILLTVGGFAGAASFRHVHDWTMTNSPSGTGSWFGWANAVVSELVPIASMLVMRRRKKANQPIGYPVCLLMAALAVSVTAQLAVARPTAFGYLVSVVPALAFAALAKLVLGKTTVVTNHAPVTVPASASAATMPPNGDLATATIPVTRPTPSVPAPPPATVAPVPVTTPSPAPVAVVAANRPTRPSARPASPTANVAEPKLSAPEPPRVPKALPRASTPDHPVVTVDAPPHTPAVPPGLLARARNLAQAHHAVRGTSITAGELAVQLRINTSDAKQILAVLHLDPTAPVRPTVSVNGSAPVR